MRTSNNVTCTFIVRNQTADADTSVRLRRVYILFNAKHGISQVDEAMLESLNERCKASLSLQAVITKVDAIPSADVSKAIAKMRTQIAEAAPMCLPAILTSASMRPPFGIEEVRRSIVEACNLK